MKDHVPLFRRLRWGQIPFANLRFATGRDYHLEWNCEIGAVERGVKHALDCDWVGNHLRPGGLPIRNAEDIIAGNKDEWWDSTEMSQASHMMIRACPSAQQTALRQHSLFPFAVRWRDVHASPVDAWQGRHVSAVHMQAD